MTALAAFAAWLHAGLTALVFAFQIALILGAPWGHLTMGGRHPGALDATGRILAAVSAGLVVAMSLAVLSAAGIGLSWPRWTLWVAVAVASLSVLANAATRSAPERRLWLPVVLVMLGCALVVAFTT